MNILILSAGSRVKLVDYFKETFHKNNGKVYVTDCSELAPALYVADGFFLVPRIDDDSYLETVINICNENNINAVLSLIDPELSLLAENKELFIKNNIFPIISDVSVVNTCFNKFDFYEFCCENKINTVKSYFDNKQANDAVIKNEVEFPLFAKPTCGSASLDMEVLHNTNDLLAIEGDYIIQEFMDSREYGVDVYIDFITKEIIDIFIKEKIVMRAGETDKSIAVSNSEIVDLVISTLSKIDLVGPVDIDIFKTDSGYVISEINPRFGGGYLHAQESGCEFPKHILNNINSDINEVRNREFKKTAMMKYSDVVIQEIKK